MNSRQLGRADRWAAALEGRGVPPDEATALGIYLEMLVRFGRVMDLVGPVNDRALLADHVLESLAADAWLAGRRSVIDLGSGNGFPAIPLLIRHRETRGTLLEARERRWAFLREVVRELGLEAEVVRERLEDHGGRGYEAATVRGVAPRVWRNTLPRLLSRSGIVMWWRGPGGSGDPLPGAGGVVVSDLPDPRRGVLVIWRPCST